MAVDTTDFLTGEVLRDGTDTDGTKYDAEVDAGSTSETSAASFDETALDPYEVANAQA